MQPPLKGEGDRASGGGVELKVVPDCGGGVELKVAADCGGEVKFQSYSKKL